MFSRHGTVPEAGTLVRDPLNGLVFVVDEMDERRIVSVTVRRADEPADSRRNEQSWLLDRVALLEMTRS